MKLVKQQVLTEVVSVWEIDGQYIEVTQTSRGKYLLYQLSPREFKEWDNHDNVHGLGDGTKVGEKCKVIQGEWWLKESDCKENL